VIVDEAEARRLARSIIADSVLYGGEPSLSNPVQLQEIHELFLSRVDPSLHRVLVDELTARRKGVSGDPSAVPNGVQVVDGAGAGSPVVFLAIGLLVLAAGAAFFFAAR
jgi:hypothetical protein